MAQIEEKHDRRPKRQRAWVYMAFSLCILPVELSDEGRPLLLVRRSPQDFRRSGLGAMSSFPWLRLRYQNTGFVRSGVGRTKDTGHFVVSAHRHSIPEQSRYQDQIRMRVPPPSDAGLLIDSSTTRSAYSPVCILIQFGSWAVSLRS